MWNILSISKSGKYNYARVPDHPKANKDGNVLLHRVVMENHTGKMLEDGEVVHHIDGDGHNNDIGNLVIMTESSHMSMHSSARGISYTALVCANCGKQFLRRNKKINWKQERFFCNKSCSSKYAWNNRNIDERSGKMKKK